MERFSKAELKEFESELLTLYPFLSEQEAKNVIEDMIVYWSYVIENIDKISK